MNRRNLWMALTEGKLARAALLVFETRSDFQQAIEHFGTLGAARGELRVSLFVHVLEAVKFVGDVQRREDGDLQRVDGKRARRDLSHPAVDKLRELNDVFGVAVGTDVIGLVVNLDPNCRTAGRAFHTAFIDHAADTGTHLSSSAISGSRAATASSMASTFVRIVSRSASSFST